VQICRTYGPYVRPVRQAVRTARTAIQLYAQCFFAVRPVRTASPDGSAVRTARTEVGLSALAVRTARTRVPYARPAGTASPDGAAVRTGRTCDPSVIFDSRTYGPYVRLYVRPVHTAVHPH